MVGEWIEKGVGIGEFAAVGGAFEIEVECGFFEGSGDLLGQGGFSALPRSGENYSGEMGEAFIEFQSCGAPERLHIDRLSDNLQVFKRLMGVMDEGGVK